MGAAKQIVIAGALVGCAAIAIAKLPPWLVERGNNSKTACLDAVDEQHTDPAACRTGIGFAIGAAFPHVRAHARALREDLDRRRAELVVEHALETGVGAHEAIAALLARREDPTSVLEWLVPTLIEHGAVDELARIDVGNADVLEPELPVRAALALGDLALARARLAAPAMTGAHADARAGALACLLGPQERGLAVLAAADHAWRAGGHKAAADTRLAALHCGGTVATLGFDPATVPDAEQIQALLVRAYDPAFQAGRRTRLGLVLGNDISIFAADYLGAAGLAASGPTEPSVEQLLQIADVLAPRPGDTLDLWPIDVFSPEDASRADVAYVPPAWLATAAARFEHAATVAPASYPEDKLDASDEARTHPRELLRTTAARLYREAARYRLRRGDRTGLADLLAHARSLDPADLERAPVELAAGDPDAALATATAWKAAHLDAPPEDQQAPGYVQVLALIEKGDLAGAQAATRPLHGLEAQWIELALALALDQQTPVGLDGVKGELSPGRTGRAIAAQQLPRREWVGPTARHMLPLAMYAIGRAAKAAGRDPEHVLDAYFADELGSRAFALARAEAARLRKDTAAAARWQARATTIESLFVGLSQNDHAPALAGIAGLW